MLANCLEWWLERHEECRVTQKRFRGNFIQFWQTKCSMHRFNHIVRTVVATDIVKTYGHIQYETILGNMKSLCLTPQVAKSGPSSQLYVYVEGQEVGYFAYNRGVPQVYVLALLSFFWHGNFAKYPCNIRFRTVTLARRTVVHSRRPGNA